MTRHPHFKFHLYVAGDAPNSAQAINNLGAFCRTHLAERYEIEIITFSGNRTAPWPKASS